jgi:hypothetical protein
MDCDIARLFLPFDRPGGRELDGPEAEELHAHLEQCSSCNALAMNIRRLDAHLGRAMQSVEIPAGLKGRLLERLAEERGLIRRKWANRVMRAAAIAASVLLVLWGGYSFFIKDEVNRIDAQVLHYRVAVAGQNKDQVNDALKGMGAPGGAPDFVNYAYLKGLPALAEVPRPSFREAVPLPPAKVPQLIFVRGDVPGQGSPATAQIAIVYVVKKSEYKIVAPDEDIHDYPFKLAIESPGNSYVYLVLYTGKDWDWLRSRQD